MPMSEATSMLRRGTAPVYVDHSEVRAIGQRCITHEAFDPGLARPHSSRNMTGVIRPEPGDVLVNSTGTGTIGRSVVFYGDSHEFIVDGHVTVVRPRPNVVVGRWISDFIRSAQGQQYLETRCYSGSTNQVELSATALGHMQIPIPSVIEQRCVSEILDTLDNQIASSDLALHKYSKIRSAVIEGMLDGNDVARVEPLGGLAEVSSGVTLGSEPGGPGTVVRPYLRVANVQDGHLNLSDVKSVRVRQSDLARFELRTGDVLMNEGGDADKLGRGTVWEGQIDGCLHQNHVFKVRCIPSRLNPWYLALVSGSPRGSATSLRPRNRRQTWRP